MDRRGCPQRAAPLLLTTVGSSAALRLSNRQPNRAMNKEQLHQLVEFREQVRELRGYL